MLNKIFPLFLTIFLLQSLSGFSEEMWDRVYLASYPRSGNHWLRYLIEEVTGIATSSVARDGSPQHSKRVFPWVGFCPPNGYEGIRRYPRKGETVVIKTHFPAYRLGQGDLRSRKRVIRVVRNPIDSFHSFYMYRPNRKGNTVPKDVLKDYIKGWRRFQEYWNEQEDVVTVRYEDLLVDLLSTFSVVMDATGYEYTEESLKRAVVRYPPIGYELKHLKYFSEEDCELIYEELGDLMHQFHYYIPDNYLKFGSVR